MAGGQILVCSKQAIQKSVGKRFFFIVIKIYQEVDIDHCGCRHFPWGRRRA